MKAFDLVDVRLPFVVGDKLFHLRRLRLSDLLRALARFDDHLQAISEQNTRPDPVKLLTSLSEDDTADLFAYFLEPHDPLYLRSRLTFDKRAELLTLIRATHDLGRIWESLKVSRGKQEKDEKAGIEPTAQAVPIPALLTVIDRLAQRYGKMPTEVVDLPYEAFLTLVDLVDAEAVLRQGLAMEAGEGLPEGFDYDNLDDAKIPVRPMPDLNREH